MSLQEQVGLWRSVLIYYGVPGRIGRIARFFAPFIQPGALCFDVGAHVGNRIAAWRRLGARVVALEPYPPLVSWLGRLYGRDPNITILPLALGEKAGTASLHLDPTNPTVSTLSTDWMAAVQQDSSFAGVRWQQVTAVPITTLDILIEQYGLPAFCKIDVEGYELQVLRGLSQPLPALSFEYIPITIEDTFRCLARLGELAGRDGGYEYNYFEGESHRWQSPTWLDADALATRLAACKRSGDVVARLKR